MNNSPKEKAIQQLGWAVVIVIIVLFFIVGGSLFVNARNAHYASITQKKATTQTMAVNEGYRNAAEVRCKYPNGVEAFDGVLLNYDINFYSGDVSGVDEDTKGTVYFPGMSCVVRTTYIKGD